MAFDGSRQWVHCTLCQQEHGDIRYVHEYQLMSAFTMLNRKDFSDFRTSTDAMSLLRSFVFASRCHLRQLIQMWGKSASAEVVDAEIVRLDNQLVRITGRTLSMQLAPIVTNVRVEQISESFNLIQRVIESAIATAQAAASQTTTVKLQDDPMSSLEVQRVLKENETLQRKVKELEIQVKDDTAEKQRLATRVRTLKEQLKMEQHKGHNRKRAVYESDDDDGAIPSNMKYHVDGRKRRRLHNNQFSQRRHLVCMACHQDGVAGKCDNGQPCRRCNDHQILCVRPVCHRPNKCHPMKCPKVHFERGFKTTQLDYLPRKTHYVPVPAFGFGWLGKYFVG